MKFTVDTKLKLSDKINFNEIPRNLFITFLELLKKGDLKEYIKEGQDGFLDLYNYWSHKERGLSRFNEKLLRNRERWS